jgi:hypothetical protein
MRGPRKRARGGGKAKGTKRSRRAAVLARTRRAARLARRQNQAAAQDETAPDQRTAMQEGGCGSGDESPPGYKWTAPDWKNPYMPPWAGHQA